MKNYTIIWEHRWMSGSHMHWLTKKTFVRCLDPSYILNSNYGPSSIYIFEGHITTLGEEVSEENIINL